MPLKAMNNERALWKFIVFGLITCGIYPIVFWSGIGEDLNIAATRRDGKKTMHSVPARPDHLQHLPVCLVPSDVRAARQ